MAPVDPDAPAREMYMASFANGVDFYFDRHQHAIPTHFGDEKGVQHALVGVQRVSDDEEVRFVEPGKGSTTAPPAVDAAPTVPPEAVSYRDAEYLRRIDELERELKVGKYAEQAGTDFVPSG